MSKYYTKRRNLNYKKFTKLLGVALFLGGISISLYIFSPLILWQIYSAPLLSSQNVKTPIPKNAVVKGSIMQSLFFQARDSITGVDFTNAKNWFPDFKTQENSQQSKSYLLSIPSLDIKNATVSNSDYDLTKHLVNYIGTPTPPSQGNAVIFGHSTLPQLFNSKDYKTIFANLHKVKIGDEINISADGISYLYRVYNIYIVDANDMSVFTQNFDNSYITLVTCTPPGTIWKRLVVNARLQLPSQSDGGQARLEKI